jgi:formate/nitrite transporter FocA (FNT family)
MSSDLSQEKSDEIEPKKASRQILLHEILEGRAVLERPVAGLFVSALSAGLDIGFSLFLMAVMKTRLQGESFSPTMAELLIANAYAVGFIFVVLGRSELFTEQTTLAVLPVLNRKASLAALARTWAVVYLANLIGAAGFAALSVVIGPMRGIIDQRVFGEIATSLTTHTALSLFLGAVLAGWLMGLMSWLVAASRDTISQVVLVGIIATVIGFANLPHVVAGSVEVLAGVFANQGVTAADFGHFLLWTTLGNVLGGSVFVALIKYGHAIQSGPADQLSDEKTTKGRGGERHQAYIQQTLL